MANNIEKIENLVLKLCSFLRVHVDLWEETMIEIEQQVNIISNFSEQMNCVKHVNVLNIENMVKIKEVLNINVIFQIEEELDRARYKLKNLHQINQNLKSKLAELELATVFIDWDYDAPVITGTPLQPPLRKILEIGYQFGLLYVTLLRNIENSFNKIDLKVQKSIENFINTFSVESKGIKANRTINNMLALTQYVNKGLK